MVPEPATDKLAPVPTTIAAPELVLEVSALNAVDPPLPHPAPASSIVVLVAHSTQCPEVIPPVNTGIDAPASVVAPVPPLPVSRVPVTPVLSGSPVAFVRVIAVGTPSAGVVRVGDVDSTTVVPVPVVVAFTSWLEPFVARTAELLGIEAPSTRTTVVVNVFAVVTSPDRLPFVMDAAPENKARF